MWQKLTPDSLDWLLRLLVSHKHLMKPGRGSYYIERQWFSLSLIFTYLGGFIHVNGEIAAVCVLSPHVNYICIKGCEGEDVWMCVDIAMCPDSSPASFIQLSGVYSFCHATAHPLHRGVTGLILWLARQPTEASAMDGNNKTLYCSKLHYKWKAAAVDRVVLQYVQWTALVKRSMWS